MKQFLKMLPVLLIFASCGNSLEDKLNHQFHTMKEMAELGTVEYTITKVVKANDNAFYTIGERKILFSCKATMKAGIDLAEFDQEKVSINKGDNSVSIVLPKPKILAFNMPADEVKLEYEKLGKLRSEFSAEERNNLLKQGEEAILADAENLGVIQDAEKNARLFFEALLGKVGFKAINIKFE